MATTTKAKFTPASSAPKARKTVDQQAVMSRAIAGKTGEVDDSTAGPQVEVIVPHAFKLTDDGHIVHPYPAGKQKMPKAHAEHPYSIANGVTLA